MSASAAPAISIEAFEAGRTLDRYYSKELLQSDHARQQFLLPDKVMHIDA